MNAVRLRQRTSPLRAADALANPAPVVQVITAWQHTAEVHADPDLAARIHLLEGDSGTGHPRTTD